MLMGLTKLGAAMIIVFIVATVVALFLEIMCVLFQRSHKLGGRVRVEPQESSGVAACVPRANMIKCGYYGAPRTSSLFTIKEGEREGLDSHSTVSSAENNSTTAAATTTLNVLIINTNTNTG
ncbi:hypothetical protein PIB30_007718 [Stylosanthes scabra]|uniref:Uncharacterized protein n=1 Tax=Stylosanthes scabra TaxID=79078 RepID=A0ABU6X4R9_9FABA|nr:hypothetical protein [Stylosanthes scabra]